MCVSSTNNNSTGDAIESSSKEIMDHPTDQKSDDSNENDNNSNLKAEDRLDVNLQSYNAFFKEVINLVPTQYYFDTESKEKLEENVKYNIKEQGKSKEHVKGQKRAFGRELSEKAQKKRFKFDPSQQQTVTGLQEYLIQQEDRNKGKKRKKKKDDDDDDDPSLKSTSESLDDLRQRLQDKIDALRAKRNALGKADWFEKKKIKRREHTVKQRLKSKKEKANRVKGQAPIVVNGSVSPNAVLTSPHKPIFNKDGKIVFSKFDFSEAPNTKKEKLSELPKGSKKYKKLLEKVERRNQKMEEIKQKDQVKAKQLEEKTAWQNVLQKAEGIKVRDNPDLLKKSMKRQEKRKQKSRKEWKERSDKVQEKIKERDDKRKKNIKAKKQGKIDKKIKKAKKKGRLIPGF